MTTEAQSTDEVSELRARLDAYGTHVYSVLDILGSAGVPGGRFWVEQVKDAAQAYRELAVERERSKQLRDQLEQARAAVGLAEQERDQARAERDEARRVADATANEATELLEQRARTIADLRTTNDELGKHAAACETRHREINEQLLGMTEDRDRWMRKESEAWGHCTKQIQKLEAERNEARDAVLIEIVKHFHEEIAARVDSYVRLLGTGKRLEAISILVEQLRVEVLAACQQRDQANEAARMSERIAVSHHDARAAAEHDLAQARASIAALTVETRKYRALYEGQKLETEFAQAASTQLLAEVRKVNAMLAYERAMRTTAGGAS